MAGEPAAGEPSEDHRPLILVVEDTPDARYLYTQYLGFHGLQVIEAKDGEQAIRLASEAMPALIFRACW